MFRINSIITYAIPLTEQPIFRRMQHHSMLLNEELTRLHVLTFEWKMLIL